MIPNYYYHYYNIIITLISEPSVAICDLPSQIFQTAIFCDRREQFSHDLIDVTSSDIIFTRNYVLRPSEEWSGVNYNFYELLKMSANMVPGDVSSDV